MKRISGAAIAALLKLSVTSLAAAPAHAASSPVPGRFCKVADVGKKINTTKYGIVVCKKEGSRARWK